MSENQAPSGDDALFGQEHVEAYRKTDGEHGFHWRGTTILLLTTRGSKTGQQRTTPLIHRVDDGRYVVVASQGGAPEHPSWFKNLEAHPDGTRVQVRDQESPVRHSVAQGEERERLWALMTEVWPDYDAYQARTEREIPVVVLEPR